MSGDSRGLRDLIEASASAAQLGPLARLQDDYDDDDNERPETVGLGAAIEGAATTITDSARQAAALVSNQPSHNSCSHLRSVHCWVRHATPTVLCVRAADVLTPLRFDALRYSFTLGRRRRVRPKSEPLPGSLASCVGVGCGSHPALSSCLSGAH